MFWVLDKKSERNRDGDWKRTEGFERELNTERIEIEKA